MYIETEGGREGGRERERMSGSTSILSRPAAPARSPPPAASSCRARPPDGTRKGVKRRRFAL